MCNLVYIRINKNSVEHDNPKMPSTTILWPFCSGLIKLGVTPGGGGIAPITAMTGGLMRNKE